MPSYDGHPEVWSAPAPDEECSDWGPAPAPIAGKSKAKLEEPSSTAGAAYGATGALAGLPMIIGSWCWPVLVGAATGVAVSQTSVLLSHTLQFAFLLAVFTNLTQHTLYTCWRKRRGCCRFGPAYVMAASTLFIMVYPTYLVLKFGKQIDLHGLGLGGGRCGVAAGNPLHICTMIGYVLLIFGALWSADVFYCCASPRDNRDEDDAV